MGVVVDVQYKSESIKSVLEQIDSKQILLPSIQRRFVWNHEQVENLFDSLLSNYPIGTFLFWHLKNDKNRKKYVFYELIRNIKTGYIWNDKAPKSTGHKHISAILDGQQRLTALYAGIHGSYKYKTPGKWWDKADSWPIRYLHLNLLYKQSAENDSKHEFKFITAEEAEFFDLHHYWFKLGRILDFSGEGLRDANNTVNQIKSLAGAQKDKLAIERRRPEIKDILVALRKEICTDTNINYAKLNTPDLDDILDIFVRVNSGGVVLSKSDLLFSTITSKWEEGREEVEELIKSCNRVSNLAYDSDLIMRSCLMLLDLGILFKVKGFSFENVEKIIQQWPKIAKAIAETTDVLKEIQLSKNILNSKNSLIPIFYYRYKGGKFDEPEKKEIKRYLIHANLKNVFGSHGDSVLRDIRTILAPEIEKNATRVLTNNRFNFIAFAKAYESNYSSKGKSFLINEKDIDSWLTQAKKGAQTHLILSLLYGNTGVDFISLNQDHIHPDATLRKHPDWKPMKDKLPNLMFLKETVNKRKQDDPFASWLESSFNEKEKELFLRENFIPDVDLGLDNFAEFYTKREQLLKDQLMRLISNE